MEKLGKYSDAKSCLYIKRLSDIHLPTLKKLIKTSVKELKAYTKAQSAQKIKSSLDGTSRFLQ